MKSCGAGSDSSEDVFNLGSLDHEDHYLNQLTRTNLSDHLDRISFEKMVVTTMQSRSVNNYGLKINTEQSANHTRPRSRSRSLDMTRTEFPTELSSPSPKSMAALGRSTYSSFEKVRSPSNSPPQKAKDRCINYLFKLKYRDSTRILLN
jgi:hypothetical protein